MKFVLSDIVTYNKLYASEGHNYIQLKSLEDLEGFQGIHVIIHEFDALDDEQDIIQKQLEALAAFRFINLVYMDDEGNENKFFNLIGKVLP